MLSGGISLQLEREKTVDGEDGGCIRKQDSGCIRKQVRMKLKQ